MVSLGNGNAPNEPATADDAVVLGLFGAAHLGDTLCTSPLPRLLGQRLNRPIYVADHPMARAVFAANPHVSGFAGGETIALNNRMIGNGHVLQRLAQGLELPVEPTPRPEIYLSGEETEWAAAERRRWPADRPVCVLSTAAETDRGNLERVDWEAAARVLCREWTIVQPVLAERPERGTVPYFRLPVRRYMALIAAADCFMGGTSGGSHVAAAFGVPSLIVAWRSLLDHLRFPVSGLGVVAAFCYPQHWFIAAEDLGRACFREEGLLGRIREMTRNGRAERRTHIGNYPSRPCGFVPAIPRPVKKVGNRVVRLPPVLSGCG